MMIHQQDAVGLGLLDQRLRMFLPARSKRNHLMRLLGELAGAKPSGETGLAVGLHAVANRVRKRGLMILFSDLLCEPEPVLDALHRLRYAGHDVVVFCVLDEAEATFPFRGSVRFEDPETGESMNADAVGIQRDYLAALSALMGRYRHALSSVRCDFELVHNAMSFDKALVRFLIDRQARF
ncbi:MAG: DUF58 domain-containing protein, partial [Phycisphaerae bacterium]